MTGRFSPEHHYPMPVCRHYDPQLIDDALIIAAGRLRARDLAVGLGIQAITADGRTTISHEHYVRIDEALAGRLPGYAHATWTMLLAACRRRPLTICPVGLALLERMRIHVGTALLLAVVNDAGSPGSVDGLQLVSEGGHDQIWLDVLKGSGTTDLIRTMSASIGIGAFWSDDSISVEGLPETVIAQLPGRPLADLLRHPDIDPLGFTITHVTQGMECVDIHTDHSPEPVDVATLCVEAIRRIEATPGHPHTLRVTGRMVEPDPA